MELPDFGELSNLAKQMQDAYSQGLGAMNQAGEIAAAEMDPDYKIILDIDFSAKIEGHAYQVDATVIFEIELQPILDAAENSPLGDLASLLGGLGVDLGEDSDAVMEQLGQPRAIGVVSEIDLRKLVLSGANGKIDAQLNEKGTLLATLTEGKLHINCESVFSYPEHTDAFVAIPSMEAMQENIVLDLEHLEEKQAFKWTEPDKDNLQVSGTIHFEPI
ncbi:hypothetical protein JR338_01065 [Chloroflexota bacterium]|nr:hypothetical protein JR338_01065 [Chloroflexota bacterium]